MKLLKPCEQCTFRNTCTRDHLWINVNGACALFYPEDKERDLLEIKKEN